MSLLDDFTCSLLEHTLTYAQTMMMNQALDNSSALTLMSFRKALAATVRENLKNSAFSRYLSTTNKAQCQILAIPLNLPQAGYDDTVKNGLTAQEKKQLKDSATKIEGLASTLIEVINNVDLTALLNSCAD